MRDIIKQKEMTLIAMEEAGRLQCFIKRTGYQTVAGLSDKIISATRKTVDNIKRCRQGRNHFTINQIF